MRPVLKSLFLRITARYPGAVLLVAILLGVLSLYIASGLVYEPRMDNLLPQDLDVIKEFNEVVAKTGGSGPLVVTLEKLTQKQAEQIIEDLARKFKAVPGIRYIDYKLPRKFLEDRQLLLASRQDLLELEQLIDEAIDHAREEFGGLYIMGAEDFNPERLQAFAGEYHIFEDLNPYYNGKRVKEFYVKGKAVRNFYMFIQPEGTVTDTAFTENFVRQIQQVIDESGWKAKYPDINVRLTGSIIVRLEENRTIVRDLARAAMIAAGVSGFIIVLYTQSGFSIPLIIFPLLLSLAYTFALTRLLIGHVNIISGFLVAILLGLGIDYGIHLYIRFKQELLKGKPTLNSVELVITQVGRSGAIAMLTTISIFSILIFSSFKGFSEFGQIATMGILSAFVTYFFVFPAQILFYDRIHWLRKPRPRMFNLRISNLYTHTPYFLTALFLLLMVSSLFLLPGVEFEYDFRKLRGASPEAEYETKTTNDFGYAFSPTLILTPTRENLFYVHQALEKIKRRNGKDTTIGHYHSLNLFTKMEYNYKKDVLDRIANTFEEDKDIIILSLGDKRTGQLSDLIYARPFDENRVPQSIVRKLTAGGEYLVLLLSPASKNFFDIRNIFQLEEEIHSLKAALKKQNIPISVLNENLMAAEIMNWVKSNGLQTVAMAIGIVFLILLIDLGSFGLALKTFLPLLTGLALSGALMSVFQIKLNFINFVMVPSIVGIMIDHCIYLAHHILDYNQKNTLKSVKETGSAIILSALTTLAGYASLNVATHAGIRSIAHLMELGIITCTLCALFMLPALFELGHHKLALIKSGSKTARS
ncbi:MAG: hypothetical protein COV67_13845 [Nitrospinae bacterium CG11_big_fil_rev_8_21_14_0_20_56_8]|nr:MAG: hypothetical protein COV67_13845 [Nitrospinae bacterium CG11_big_fil_rev_8_21_14_0_20_56_8]